MDTGQTTGSRLGELLRLAGPVILARLGIMAMGLTDAIVVGRYSSTELGYHALGWGPTSVVLTMAVGLLTGVQVMTARYVGEGRAKDTGLVLRRGCSYALWIGFASMAALMAAGPLFLRATGLEPTLAAGAGHALRIFALSLPFYLVSCAVTFWLEALGKPTPGMVAMWLANIVNLVLNLWLVPGHSGLPVAGAVAAAWATFGSRGALLAMQIFYVWQWRGAREHGVFERRAEDGRAAEQRRIGYGAGASYFVESAAFAGMGIIAGLLAALDAAAWAIVLNVAAIIFMGPLGLASATAVLVGRSVGARDRHGVVVNGVLGFAVTAVLTGIIGLIVWIWAAPFSALYTRDPALIALVAPAIALSSLFFVADGLQVVGANACRARGDIWWPTATHVVSYTVVMLPLGWWFAHTLGLGIAGCVWSVVVASLLAAGFLTGRFAVLARRPLDGVVAVG